MKSETVVLLTGGSSGIGQCTARYLAEAGCRVYELSRRDSSQPGIIHLTCDVTREEQVQAAVKTVAEREGRIDIVVNNAGFGISGAVEFTQTADAQRLLDVNFFGMVRVNRAVLPYMREEGTDCESQLRSGGGAHSLSDLLFCLQGGGECLYHGPGQ